MIRIVLADDHVVVRSGVRAVLEQAGMDIEIAAELSNGQELIEYADKHKDIDVYIVDLSMPVLNGLEAISRMTKKDPDVKIVVLSMYDDRLSVQRSLKAGAKGYLVKISAGDEIAAAVKDVYEGGFYLSKPISTYIIQGFLGKDSPVFKKGMSMLTPKEKAILQLVAEGASSKQIAAHFGLALNTVHVHRNNIMRKLKIHRQADLVRYALKEGIAQL